MMGAIKNCYGVLRMKSLMKKVDLFCYKHPRFGIPNLMLYVVIGGGIVWLFNLITTNATSAGSILSYLYFSPYLILHGQVWRLVTFIIIPPSTSILTLIALYFYYFIGTTLERQWGPGKFTIYFFTGVLLTIVYGFLVYFIFGTDVLLTYGYPVSAHYIYLSMFFTFASLYPDMRVLLFFVIPIKMKWLAIVDAVFFVYEVIVNPFPIDLLPVIAILNYLLFCGGDLFDALRRALGGSRKQRQNTVNFHNEVRRMEYEQRQKTYTRRCEVCGRTDTDHPELEFRYCSRCQGYHCFCMDHINNHKHFTE